MNSGNTLRQLIGMCGVKAAALRRTLYKVIGIQDIHELGNGIWAEGAKFKLDDRAARLDQTLASIGRNVSRGTTLGTKPVWLAISTAR